MARIQSALLVDDDHAFRMTLQLALRRRGVQARTAATAEEGLIALEQAPADLIVIDNRMPHGDGMSALSRYRAQAPDSVIIMLTGYADIPLAVSAVRKGADLFLPKPIDADKLLREAESILDQPRGASHLPPARNLNLKEVERETISAALQQSGGVIAHAAELLGIDRRTLQRKLKRFF